LNDPMGLARAPGGPPIVGFTRPKLQKLMVSLAKNPSSNLGAFEI
jgi:hypothetical protein